MPSPSRKLASLGNLVSAVSAAVAGVANRLRIDAPQSLTVDQKQMGRDNLGLGTAATGSANDLITSAERTKLAGVADQATKNATDASLRDRSTHTGTQPLSTIQGAGTMAAQSADSVSITGGSAILSGAALSGSWPSLAINKASTAEQNRIFGQINGANLWTVRLGDNASQTGGNAGANFGISRHADTTGAFIDTPISIDRGTGKTSINVGLAVFGSVDLNAVPKVNGVNVALQSDLSGNTYKGTWNANTNTPTITSSVGTKGDFYKVSVAGNTTINGVSGWVPGDEIRFDGTQWQKIPAYDSVTSVAGKTGAVALAIADISGLSAAIDSANTNANSRLLASGGQMTGTLGLAGIGTNSFFSGNGDAASYTTHNLKLRVHYGWGIETYDGSVNGFYDARTGTWDVKGGYRTNGVSIFASPALTGTPTVPTAAAGTNTTQVASTAFVKAAVDAGDAAINAKIGAANGIAPLDSTGKVSSTFLPSYVDDVLSFTSLSTFPGTGESGKIYVAEDTGKIYRWSGSAYVEISASPGSTDAVPEGASNRYFTEARVRATPLTGLSTSTNAAIAATDTLLVALGKLQAQISGGDILDGGTF